jgi:hypothetical protein
MWLDERVPGEKLIVDTSTVLAFHAGAEYVPYPYADSDVAWNYLVMRGVRFVVLRDDGIETIPYLEEWMERGVPSDEAELIYSTETTARGRLLIYEIEHGGE